MRIAIWVVLIALVLLIAVALAPLFNQDPGYVLIQLGQWNIETNVLVIAALLLLVFIILRLLFWVINLPRRAARNLAQRRLEHGLLALAEGDWQQAEHALRKSAPSSGLEKAGYLAAARAASGQLDDEQASQRQQQYLVAADDGQARTRFLVQLSRARLHMSKGEFGKAVPLLQAIRKRRRWHAQTLKMLATCYRELGQWAKLRTLLPALRKARIVDRKAAFDIEILAATNELRSATDSEHLQASWEALLRPQRHIPDVIAAYARQALAFGQTRLAEGVLLNALQRKLDDELLDLYAQCHADSSKDHLEKPLQRAEKWRQQAPDNAAVERLLGQLCIHKKLWGKARQHLLESLRLLPHGPTYELLGDLLQRQGELQSASNCYYNALQLSRQQEGALSLRPIHAQPDNRKLAENPDQDLSLDADKQQQQLKQQQQVTGDSARHHAADELDAIGDMVTLPEAYQSAADGDDPANR